MGEGDIEVLLDVVPEELTNELLELEQERTAEEAREREKTIGEKITSEKIHSELFSRSFCRPQ